MTEPLEDLIQRAMASGVTYITLDRGGGATYRAGAWKAFSHFGQAYDTDPVVALRGALHAAMTPRQTATTDLTKLLT